MPAISRATQLLWGRAPALASYRREGPDGGHGPDATDDREASLECGMLASAMTAISHEEKVSVAFDATPLLGARTGVGAFASALLDRLALQPDVAVTAYGVTWRGRRDLSGVVPPGVAVCRRPMAARPLRWAWTKGAFPPLEWWTGPLDVVHGTNFVVPPTTHAARVVTVHDLTSLHHPELCDVASLALPSLLRRALAQGAWVHAVSRFVADEVVADLGADRERVVAIHSGVPPVSAARRGDGRRLVGADTYVLALGTVEPRKDLPTLVRAFDALAGPRPDLRLVIAGADGWGVEALREALSTAHYRRQILRLGWVDDGQRAGLLADATVLAYPSRYEGFGFPPLEAMAMGVPVVATRVGALPEVLGHAATFVTIGDVDALASALAELIDDSGRRRAQVEFGYRQVKAYDWNRTTAAMVALYRRAAAEHQ